MSDSKHNHEKMAASATKTEASINGKVITCKAMVQWSNGADLCEETIQVAFPKGSDVRVKILARYLFVISF